MQNITKDNVSDFTVTGEFEISASVKPEHGSDETKQVTLRFKMVAEPLSSIIRSSLKDKRINWQVGARKKFAKIVNRSIVDVDYKGGPAPEDPVNVVATMLAGKTEAEQLAWLRAEVAKRQAPKLEPLK